jgi:hypothetical protein
MFTIMLVAASCHTATRGSTVYTLGTSAREFDSGVLNQGFWCNTGINADSNDNYIIALWYSGPFEPFPQGIISRAFFTFDLSGINGTIQSATLLLRRGDSRSPNPTETLSFWDVQTPVGVLNDNVGNSASIADDLGSGNNYGYFQVSMVGPASEVLPFTLNATAIADLNAGLGNYFSIGGSMEGQPAPGIDRHIFGVSQGFAAFLEVTVVPEPSAAALIVVFALSSEVVRRRRHSQSGRG